MRAVLWRQMAGYDLVRQSTVMAPGIRGAAGSVKRVDLEGVQCRVVAMEK